MSEDRTHQPFCIPVRDNRCGFTLRLFRDRDGSRCAVAFTTPEGLTAVLGVGQRWLPLSEDALRDLLQPLGVQRLTIDPNLVAPPVRSAPRPAPQPAAKPAPELLRPPGRQQSGALTGVAGGPAVLRP